MCRQARHALPGTLVRHHRSFRVNQVLRPGFARLVAEITMGHVGLVLGLEMSRLARAGRDWHQLIELCSLAGALLADADGVYDPNWYNDRLLPQGDDERTRDFPDPAADAGCEAGQGRARGARPPASRRLRPPPVGRGRLRPRRAGAARRPPHLRHVQHARDPQRRAPLPCRKRDPASRAAPHGTGERATWSGGARRGKPCRTCCATRPTRAITPTGGGRSTPRRKIPGRPDTGKVVRPAGEWLGQIQMVSATPR
jgi:hypothetical protein